MASKNLSEFITNFAKDGRTEENYGNYYAISGPTADLIMYSEPTNTKVFDDDNLEVIMVRLKHNDKIIIFHNDGAINSNRHGDRYLASSAAKAATSVHFPFPGETFSLSEDLSNLKIVDMSDYDLLFELPGGKYLLTFLPNIPCSRIDFINYAPGNKIDTTTVITRVASSTMKASKEALLPKGIEDTDKLAIAGGVWLKDLGKTDIEEFNPTPEEILSFNNRPMLSQTESFYDVLLYTATTRFSGFIDSSHYDYRAPFSGESFYSDMFKEKAKAFRVKLENWKIKASYFTNRYVDFNKSKFLGTKYALSSSVNTMAQYFCDGENCYIKGVLSENMNHDRTIPRNAMVLPTWHQMIYHTDTYETL